MGRGDRRTRKGKTSRKSFGNSRLRLSNLRKKMKKIAEAQKETGATTEATVEPTAEATTAEG